MKMKDHCSEMVRVCCISPSDSCKSRLWTQVFSHQSANLQQKGNLDWFIWPLMSLILFMISHLYARLAGNLTFCIGAITVW